MSANVAPLECHESENDERREQRVDLASIRRDNHCNHYEHERDRALFAVEEQMDGGEQHEPVQEIPEQQARGEGQNGEGRHQEREGGAVLVEIPVRSGMLAVEIAPRFEIDERRAIDREVIALL